MSKSRTQRYRVTSEFVLKDRGEYQVYCEIFQRFFRNLEATSVGFQSDYLAIEKVEEEKR